MIIEIFYKLDNFFQDFKIKCLAILALKISVERLGVEIS